VIRRGDLRPAFFVPVGRSRRAFMQHCFWGIGLKAVGLQISVDFGFMQRRVVGLNWDRIERGLFLPFTVGDGLSVFFVSLHAKDQKVRG